MDIKKVSCWLSGTHTYTRIQTYAHTDSISTAGCQVLKLTKRSISNEGFSSCHSMGYTTNSVYVCVRMCVKSVCFQLAPLNFGSSVSPGTCRNKFVFGVWLGLVLCVCVCVSQWVGTCVGEVFQRSGHYYNTSASEHVKRAVGRKVKEGREGGKYDPVFIKPDARQ